MQIRFFKGDNLVAPFEFQKNGVAESVVGATITLVAKKRIQDLPLISLTGTIIDDGSPSLKGKFNVAFLPADTNSIEIDGRHLELICIITVTIVSTVHTTEGTLWLDNK